MPWEVVERQIALPYEHQQQETMVEAKPKKTRTWKVTKLFWIWEWRILIGKWKVQPQTSTSINFNSFISNVFEFFPCIHPCWQNHNHLCHQWISESSSHDMYPSSVKYPSSISQVYFLNFNLPSQVALARRCRDPNKSSVGNRSAAKSPAAERLLVRPLLPQWLAEFVNSKFAIWKVCLAS